MEKKDEYHTGLRQLFEMIRYGGDKEQLQKIMEKNSEEYSNLDSDTREMFEVMANVKFPEGHKSMEGEERYSMLKAFEDMRLEGKMEERREHLVQVICKKLQKNKSAEVIADELEEELSEVERVIAAQKEVGSYDVEQICKVLMEFQN